jgi:hypothetical protein
MPTGRGSGRRRAFRGRSSRDGAGCRLERSPSIDDGAIAWSNATNARLPGGAPVRIAIAAVAAFVCSASSAWASELIARDATDVRLQVNRSGQALLSYRAYGRARNVLAWGAVNARASDPDRRQVAFRLNYSAGSAFANACVPASPPLAWLVTACRAPDGSFWAVQRWQRTLPNYGVAVGAGRGAWELRLSHWSGPLPRLQVHFGWTYGRFHQLFGRLTYRGLPVYGFRSTPSGQPLDDYGRNVYVDTLDSAYGSGWRRENSFLTHRPSGGFCYGLYAHGNRPSGRGTRYRATVIGPGATPDAYWEGVPPGTYDRQFDRRADHHMRKLLGDDPGCPPR